MSKSAVANEKQYAGACIFCGGRPLSREHVYADWMRDLLPDFQRTLHKVSLRLRRFHSAGMHEDVAEKPGAMNQSGAPRSRKLRVVCRPCNGGWMSVMQARAKNHIEPLLRGEWTPLSDEALQAIASWASMFTIVWEQADLQTAAINVEVRKQFMDTGVPPSGWRIWIGRADEVLAKDSFAHHRGTGLRKDGEATPLARPGMPPPMNIQAMIAAPGQFCFVTFFSREPGHDTDLFLGVIDDLVNGAGLQRIWPPPAQVDVSLVRPVSKGTAELMMDNFTGRLDYYRFVLAPTH